MDDLEKIAELKKLFKVKTDEQLAQKLGVGVFAVRNWKIRKSLPKKYELILLESEKRFLNNSTSVVIHGSNSGHFVNNSDNVNLNSAPSDNRDDVVLTEFCELYEAHRTPQIQKELAKLTEILRKIKSAYDSDL